MFQYSDNKCIFRRFYWSSKQSKTNKVMLTNEVSYLVLAFLSDVLVTQIEYIVSRLKGQHTDLFVRKFNIMVFYRFENPASDYFEYEVFRYLNDFRKSKSLPLKKLSKKLSKVARSKAIDCGVNNDFSHYSRYYGKYGEIYKYFGLEVGGYENAASGVVYPDRLLQAWFNSPPHYNAMTWGASHFAGGVIFLTDGGKFYSGSFSDLDKWEHEPFTFGENYLFENAYETMDPVLERKVFLLIGIIMVGVILCIAAGVVIALSVKKYRQKKVVLQDVV